MVSCVTSISPVYHSVAHSSAVLHRADDKGGQQLDNNSADQRAIVLERGAGTGSLESSSFFVPSTPGRLVASRNLAPLCSTAGCDCTPP